MPLQGAALALSKCALFKDFSETGIAIVASIAAERVMPAGTPLFVEGMAADAFFVVKSGSVRVTIKRDGGQAGDKRDVGDQTIGYLGVGEALGQLSLLGTAGARLVSAVTEGNTEVIEVRQRDFVKLQAQKPQACLKLMMAVASQLGQYLGDNRDALRAAAFSR